MNTSSRWDTGALPRSARSSSPSSRAPHDRRDAIRPRANCECRSRPRAPSGYARRDENRFPDRARPADFRWRACPTPSLQTSQAGAPTRSALDRPTPALPEIGGANTGCNRPAAALRCSRVVSYTGSSGPCCMICSRRSAWARISPFASCVAAPRRILCRPSNRPSHRFAQPRRHLAARRLDG